MTALVVFSEGEPLLLVARRQAIGDGRLVEELALRGITKFIAHEVPVEKLRDSYGAPFAVIEREVNRGSPARVLDYDGRRIFEILSVVDLGPSISYDPGGRPSTAKGNLASAAHQNLVPRRSTTASRP